VAIAHVCRIAVLMVDGNNRIVLEHPSHEKSSVPDSNDVHFPHEPPFRPG